ncbi:MAG: ABC transporter permease [Candidatus Zophobacter franzmannii]|nr:ABC transporter permease [Candidatus Zophobacter franzmannii]
MHIRDSFNSSFQTIVSHKLRSFLTLIGIVIGVMAVVTMFSAIDGMKRYVKDNMEKMGWDNSIIITPSTQQNYWSMRYRYRKQKRNVEPLNYKDYTLLTDSLSIKMSYGMIEENSNFVYDGQKKFVKLRATTNDFLINKTYEIGKGRMFSNFEEKNSVKVCIVGYYFAKKYFKNKTPLNQAIKLGNQQYRIVGILADDPLGRNKSMNFNFNSWERKADLRAVYLPLSTGAKHLRSSGAIDYIYIQAPDLESYKGLKNRARQLLLSTHNMYSNFGFQNVGSFLMQITEQTGKIMDKFNVTLSIIASVSLLVGGIGLFSTLLISITERMKEIGIRKSIGATSGDIFFYFIAEALSLSLLGASGGVGLAMILLKLFSGVVGMPFNIPVLGIMLGVGFALLIGFISGLYPAVKAAKINPIQAIFYFD